MIGQSVIYLTGQFFTWPAKWITQIILVLFAFRIGKQRINIGSKKMRLIFDNRR